MEEAEYPIPTDLSSCFEVLNKIMSNSEKSESDWFKNTNEEDVLSTVHHGFGRQIRNGWGLWDKTSALYQYFNKMGLWHADDMSSVIIKSYHRFINGKEICLSEQIKHYSDYWENYEKNNGPLEKSQD